MSQPGWRPDPADAADELARRQAEGRPGFVPELTSVADDEAVLHWPADGGRPARAARWLRLQPGRSTELDGIAVRTLPRPGGQRLATVATVNDLHFGETICGAIAGTDVGPVLSSAPGEPPYPEVMNGSAVEEIAGLEPDLVVAKGDLTDSGRPEELAAFAERYGEPFGDRLVWVRGNHDVALPDAPPGPQVVERQVPGLTVAVLDTSVAGVAGGSLSADQLEWLDELAQRADRPVLVLGHHHPWSPDSRNRPDNYFGINPGASEALVDVVERRRSILAYAAGHTHRNRVRRFRATGSLPWIEVSCVKDFPGSWAEYRVFEGGVIQVHRRISTPAALAWSERCRALVAGIYPAYAFGWLADRCLVLQPR